MGDKCMIRIKPGPKRLSAERRVCGVGWGAEEKESQKGMGMVKRNVLWKKGGRGGEMIDKNMRTKRERDSICVR